MSELLEQIAIYLTELGIGKYSEVDSTGTIFLEVLPEFPNECIGLFIRGGGEGDLLKEVSEVELQIIIRDTNRLRALDTGFEIAKALCGYNTGRFVRGGYYIVDIHMLQGNPVYIDTDQSGRHEYSLNLTIEFDIREER